MEQENFQQIKATAPLSGSFIGLLWIFSFVCMANAAVNPLYSIFGMGLGAGSLFSVVYMGYQFRWKICKGNLSFGRQWLLTVMILFYACVLMAAGIFIYMKFIDGGRFAQMYTDLVSVPEQRVMMDTMMADTGVTVDDLVASIANAKPINFALQITESNLLMSFMLSPILALAARIRKPKKRV